MKFEKIVGERARRYVFPNGEYEVLNVIALLVRESGSHRLETSDGGKHIIAAGWLAIQVTAESWSL